MGKVIRALLICDIGFASPYWPIFSEHLAAVHNWDIVIVSPKMSKAQCKFFNIPNQNSRNYDIRETWNFRMQYRKYAGYSKILRKFLTVLEQTVLNMLRFFRAQLKMSQGDHTGWIPPAVKLAKSLHLEKPFDLIISTCLPFEAHQIASILKFEMQLPWIADYRDPYSYSHTVNDEPRLERIALEHKTVANADLCITTSLGFSNAIRKVYSGPIEVVHNGFDKLEPLRDSEFDEPIMISYVGSIYSDFQDISLVLNALDSFYSQFKVTEQFKLPIKLRVGGFSTHLVKDFFQQNSRSIPNWVELIGVTSIAKARKIQMESDFLLMLNWEDRDQAGVMQTKLYEYISSGTRILATGGYEDESNQILKLSGTCSWFQDAQSLSTFLFDIARNKQLPIQRNDVDLEQFSRKNQAMVINRLATDLLGTL